MDTKTACASINEIFCSITSPTWIPQYNFDFAAIPHLFHRGLNLHHVKRFLKSFNEGVKEKLNRSSKTRNVSDRIMLNIQKTREE